MCVGIKLPSLIISQVCFLYCRFSSIKLQWHILASKPAVDEHTKNKTSENFVTVQSIEDRSGIIVLI